MAKDLLRDLKNLEARLMKARQANSLVTHRLFELECVLAKMLSPYAPKKKWHCQIKRSKP